MNDTSRVVSNGYYQYLMSYKMIVINIYLSVVTTSKRQQLKKTR